MTNERLDRVERECCRLRREARYWKLTGCLLFIGGLVMIIGGAYPDKPAKSVDAEQFVLRDKAGKRRAVLEVKATGNVVLSLSDRDEKTRAALIVANDGSPVLTLQDETGVARVSLATSAEIGGSIMNVVDKAGKIRIGLSVRDDDGAPTIDLRDKDGNRRVVCGVMPDGSGTLSFHGADESQRIRIGTGRDLPSLLFFDAKQVPRLGLVVSPTSAAGLDVFSEAKRMSLGLDPKGQMGLRIIDNKTGQAVFETPKP